MIHVIATVRVQPGKRQAFLEEFFRLVPRVRAEAGCIEYGPAVDVATDIAVQVPLREDVVTIIERWESLAALKSHLAASHMAAYRQRVKDLVAGVQLQVLEPAAG
jgi:quinol monooxygenase YgiN